jgi:acyl carrier protein
MGFDHIEQLDLEDGFFQQGMDSLTAVELRGRLQRELKETMPATAIFKYPTVFHLGEYIAQNFLGHLISDSKKNDRAFKKINDAPVKRSKIGEPEPEVPSFSETELDDSVENELLELERMLNLGE